jgi:hypothetical protein
MRAFRFTRSEWVVVGLIGVVLLIMLLPTFQTIHWVGSTDLEIDFVVLDNATGQPIPGATVEIHSEGGFYEEDYPQDFELVADQDGIATRVCRNNMCCGTSGWNIDTYSVHLPWWLYRVSAPGYRATKRTDLMTVQNGSNVKRGKPAILVVFEELKQSSDTSQPEISPERIKAHVAYLASDRLEGRGPGTRGEFLTTEYLAAQFQKAGLKPIGERSTYFQPVPLVRVITSPKSTLQAVKGETTLDIPCEKGFSGMSQTQRELEEFNAEAVFVGHGITAPEFEWDDYQDEDVKGKIVVLFTNEPPSNDPKFFGGTALTYYGRWTYKFEEAARRGAKACLIIHTSETAGYPFSVVRPLEGAQLKREPGQPALAFAGWLTSEAGEKLLGLSGRTVEGALKEANTKGFKPYPLGHTKR